MWFIGASALATPAVVLLLATLWLADRALDRRAKASALAAAKARHAATAPAPAPRRLALVGAAPAAPPAGSAELRRDDAHDPAA